jgi:thymidylate synthase ThyX
MANDLQVYLLDPQQYPPETIAVAFAKTSRSPESFKQIAAELNETKSAEFNEKWVVGYGHSSVAEHAILHIAVENISRLATECLQSNRLASYTEKSTRYQTWDADAFLVPQELDSSPLKQKYLDTCNLLLDTYKRFIPVVSDSVRQNNPCEGIESEPSYERRIRSMASDVCRFLLPASVLANVGMTINARALEHALTKMLSHPLAEVRQIGQKIKSCAVEELPTLLKYADANDYLQCSEKNFVLSVSNNHTAKDWCELVQFDEDAEKRILASLLYRYNNFTYTQASEWVQQADAKEKAALVKHLLECDNKHFIPLREMEHTSFTFDITVDQGAYYEVKRHRMMTITPQALTANLGHATPRAIASAGLDAEYERCMEQVMTTYNDLSTLDSAVAAYIVPNAFNRRFLLTANLRSLLHFIKLRSAANAHFSVRRLAQKMCEQICAIMPGFVPFITPSIRESVDSIKMNYFSKV